MSEFFKALGQAERDRALREQAKSRQEAPAAEPEKPASLPASVAEPPAAVAARAAETRAPIETPRAPVATQGRLPIEAPPEPTPSAPTPTASSEPAAPSAASPFARVAQPKPRPRSRFERETGLDGHFVSLVTPATFEAEQYRALRHMVEELHKVSGLAVVAISSPSVGDGKTTTAINLAGALAQSPNNRVLLIDADLRRPAVEEKLRLQPPHSPGLVGALLDPKLALADIVRRRPPFTLDILPAGDPPAAPYEVLRSARLSALLAEAREQYDFVVLDSAPLVGLPDCRVLANFVDGFLVVVAAHRTPKRLIQAALEVVEPTRLVGLVYNMDERPVGGYYRREYGPAVNSNGHRKWPWRRH